MAKQVINYGQEANDGTGDALRTAMIKIVANFDELYDGQFSGDYADLSNKPTSITSFGITDGANGQVLSTNGSGTFTFINPPASYTNASVDTHLNTSSAANNQILSWNGTDYAWVNDSIGSGSGGLSNNEILDLVTGSNLDMGTNKIINVGTPTANTDVTTKLYVDTAVASAGGGSSLQSRVTKSVTASSLANNGTSNSIIDGFKGYNLYSIQTSHAAWVRLYISTSARTADASRVQTSDPAPDAGVIAEVITAGAETVKFGPAIAGYTDDGSTSIVAAITNLSGATNNVQVTLTLLQLEA
jgi:hypothetical protein